MTSPMHSCLLTTEHVKAMVKAMRKAKVFTITTDYASAGTVSATFTKTGERVFAAIQKGPRGNPWIVRHHVNLFQ